MNIIFEKFNSRLKLYKHRHKSRKQLRKLSDEMLSDIGISRTEADLEATKYFWETEHGSYNKHILNQKKQTTIYTETNKPF